MIPDTSDLLERERTEQNIITRDLIANRQNLGTLKANMATLQTSHAKMSNEIKQLEMELKKFKNRTLSKKEQKKQDIITRKLNIHRQNLGNLNAGIDALQASITETSNEIARLEAGLKDSMSTLILAQRTVPVVFTRQQTSPSVSKRKISEPKFRTESASCCRCQ